MFSCSNQVTTYICICAANAEWSAKIRISKGDESKTMHSTAHLYDVTSIFFVNHSIHIHWRAIGCDECIMYHLSFILTVHTRHVLCSFHAIISFSFSLSLPFFALFRSNRHSMWLAIVRKCRRTIASRWVGNRIWTKTITIHHCGWTRQWIDWITIPMKQQAFQKLTFWNIWRFPYLNKVSKSIHWKWWEVTKGESKTIYPNKNHHTQHKIFAQISDFCGFSYEIV